MSKKPKVAKNIQAHIKYCEAEIKRLKDALPDEHAAISEQLLTSLIRYRTALDILKEG